MDARSWKIAEDIQRERLAQARQEQLARLAKKEQDYMAGHRASPLARRSPVPSPLSLLRSVVALAHSR